ncbi:hypothetical protein [Flagellimonas lutaonensis]|uniref:Uncharacterized protein n=1 Tax=Flagellimonas lutaonensis TaxID=516051 RepID=A0A0D5YR25_9FLAO|nr:hypothetical protein [Allomuricauda lutaonensis]AKA34301.1 hypothetical protein VC82_634 [Allomuricauda lutaonensis]
MSRSGSTSNSSSGTVSRPTKWRRGLLEELHNLFKDGQKRKSQRLLTLRQYFPYFDKELRKTSKARGSYPKQINKLEKQDLPILDDFGLKPLDNLNRHALI